MAIEGVSGTGLEAQSSQTDAVKSLIRWESPHPLSIAGVTYSPRIAFDPATAPQWSSPVGGSCPDPRGTMPGNRTATAPDLFPAAAARRPGALVPLSSILPGEKFLFGAE